MVPWLNSLLCGACSAGFKPTVRQVDVAAAALDQTGHPQRRCGFKLSHFHFYSFSSSVSPTRQLDQTGHPQRRCGCLRPGLARPPHCCSSLPRRRRHTREFGQDWSRRPAGGWLSSRATGTDGRTLSESLCGVYQGRTCVIACLCMRARVWEGGMHAERNRGT